MNLNLRNFEEISMKGIYCIRNTVNQKMYIGSSTRTILKRLQQHYGELQKGVHKNEYLQNSWNKYGEDKFVFEIIENCPTSECLIREQFWIDYHKEKGINLYNINQIASGTSGMSQEVIDKRSVKIREFHTVCSKYYHQYKNKEITVDEIPEKYKKMTLSYFNGTPNSGTIPKGREPWNKGKQYKSTDHLRVPKANKGDSTKRLETLRAKLPEIYVYDMNYTLLGKWKNSIELTIQSVEDEFKLKPYMQLRNPDGRQGLHPYLLKGSNINKSANYNISYKGLNFRHKPLHQETGVEELDKNGEG